MALPWMNLLGELIRVFGFFALVVAPWVFFCCRCLSDRCPLTRISLGIPLGLSMFVITSWLVGFWSFDGVVVCWLLQVAFVIWFAKATVRPRPQTDSLIVDTAKLPEPKQATVVFWILIASAVALGFQLHAFSLSELPMGVDPTFHCLIAAQLQDLWRTTNTLWPLAEVKLNYPIGSHVWLAIASRYTGLDPHTVFKHSFLISMFGSAAVVGAWAYHLGRNRWHWVAGFSAFLAASHQASLFPYTWGGLPSSLAIWVWLAALYLLVTDRTLLGFWAASFLIAGCIQIHHHTMVAQCLAVVGILFWWRFRVEPKPPTRRMIFGQLAAALLSIHYTLPLALRIMDTQRTGILQYVEPYAAPWTHLWDWGPALVGLAAIGLAVVSSQQRLARSALVGAVLSWAAMFAILDYAVRGATRWFLSKPATPFTPSRFLFDIQHVLAIFAGLAVGSMVARIRFPAARHAGVFTVLLAMYFGCWAAMSGTFPWNGPSRWHSNQSDLVIPGARWAAKNLPGDALIVSASPWMSYLARRESTGLFVPISESTRTPRAELKRALETAPFQRDPRQWRALLGKPVYIQAATGTRLPGLKVVYEDRVMTLIELSADTQQPGLAGFSDSNPKPERGPGILD